MKTSLPDHPIPPLGASVEIFHLAVPFRGRVVGRSFDSPMRIDIELAGCDSIIAHGIPVNPSLKVLES